MKMFSLFSVFFVPGTSPPHPASHISHLAINALHPAINARHPANNAPHPANESFSFATPHSRKTLWKAKQSPFTKLWQSYTDPHLKIRPIAIFAFYSLNYSLAARLQDNSRPKLPTKIERKRKLQQITVSG